jgi:hypothetical protein
MATVLEEGQSVDRCTEHESCLAVVIPRHSNAGWAGTWHLEWVEADRRWVMTSPGGQVFERSVPPRESEVGSLVGSVHGIVLAGVAGEIVRRGLFPP